MFQIFNFGGLNGKELMLKINIENETSTLKTVVVGTALGFGGTPAIEEAYDPKSKEHILKGTFPKEKDLVGEMEGLVTILEKYGVEVMRPETIDDCNQLFARDIGFVIDDRFIRPRILPDRMAEVRGITHLVNRMDPAKVIEAPDGTRLEGGDVMPWNEKLFIGYSKPEDFARYKVSRTNQAGVDFLAALFPDKEVKAFELNKSDTDPKKNALHLDCCFQPIGEKEAILYKGGFKNEEDYAYLLNYFGEENVIDIDEAEMYLMNSNVFSINPKVIVSEKNFTRLNGVLRDRGFTVEEVVYSEVAKMEGLFRCTTLPLHRL